MRTELLRELPVLVRSLLEGYSCDRGRSWG